MAYDRTRLKARFFDRERKRHLGEGATLTLLEKKAGPADETLIEITLGWDFEEERRRGEVESLAVIRVTARDELAPELIARASRARVVTAAGETLYRVESYDLPKRAPLVVTLYARELKPGAVKR